MQDKNKTQSRMPKSGDGTQDIKKTRDANSFGASQEPQEEFINDHGEAEDVSIRDAKSIPREAKAKDLFRNP